MNVRPFFNGDDLIIPFASAPKYHWWNGGQSIVETLKELRHDKLIPKYSATSKGMELGGSVVSLPGVDYDELEKTWEEK